MKTPACAGMMRDLGHSQEYNAMQAMISHAAYVEIILHHQPHNNLRSDSAKQCLHLPQK
jgi:hypothetical protein